MQTKSVPNVQFSKRLKGLMDAHQLTPSTLAKKLGLTEPMVEGYLAGVMPRVDELIQVARFFGVKIDWLVGHQEPKSSPQDRAKNAQALAMRNGATEEEQRGIFELLSLNPTTAQIASIREDLLRLAQRLDVLRQSLERPAPARRNGGLSRRGETLGTS